MEVLQEYFAVHYEPRLPFTYELKRALYYETFLATSALTASVLLIFSLQYCIATVSCFRCLLRLGSLDNIAQFFLLVVPFLVCVLDYPLLLYTRFALQFDAFCCLLSVACCMHKRLCCSRSRHRAIVEPPAPGIEKPSHPPSNDCQMVYRSIVYLSTAVCIFARDQPCWRNDFSKADTFGTGLMDVGLGCFVVCIGSLGPTAVRPRAQVNRPAAMKKAGAQFLLLAGCGLVKSITVVISIAMNKTTFEESWHEYGIHWNAFFSLAVAKLGGSVMELFLLSDQVPPLAAGLVAGVGYEALLAWGGLAEYVVAPGKLEPFNRASLLGANREGVCTVPGLAVLYLLGLQLGRWTATCTKQLGSRESHTAALRHLVGRLAALLAGCLVYRIVMGGLPNLLLPESRRLLNLSYAAWIAAFSAFALLNVAVMLAARLSMVEPQDCGDSLVPIHLRHVDSAGLMYFLAANLLTGLINPLISLVAPDRESIDGWPCFVLVLLYMAVVYPAARLAHRLLNVRVLIDRLAGGVGGCAAVAAQAFSACRWLRCGASTRVDI